MLLALRRYAICSSLVVLLHGPGSILVAQPPDALSRLSREGAKALSEHRYADAERAYEQLRDLSPGVAEVHASLGFIYFQQVTLAEVAPDSLWVHLAAGEANESQGLDDAALKEYRAALATDPKRPGIHFRLGRVLQARAEQGTNGADREAEGEFAQELQDDPTNANAAYEIAEIHRKAGDLGSARTFFDTALKHYPDFEEALVGLGRSLIALQEPKLAISYLSKAVALNSKSEVAYYQLAQAHRALGDPAAQEKALTMFEQLRNASERATATATLARPEVTKQKLDPNSSGKSLR